MPRRHTWFPVGLALIAALVLAACTLPPAPRSTVTPGSTVAAVAAATATAAPTEVPSPTPTPATVLRLPLRLAPEELVRAYVPAGQVVRQAGAYFMRVDTGEIEAWTLTGYHTPNLTVFFVSRDGRWVTAQENGHYWLADRKSGTVLAWGPNDRLGLLQRRATSWFSLTRSAHGSSAAT
jgi:hypothetical protein